VNGESISNGQFTPGKGKKPIGNGQKPIGKALFSFWIQRF
jgi:hypothetical protein